MKAEMRRHWNRVAELGCIISKRPNPTIHHCHGGSIQAMGITKGTAMKTSPWLVIPLDAEFHTGNMGIDGSMGVLTWEQTFGKQVELLDKVCLLLDYNIWERAGIDRPVKMRRTI